MHCRLSDALVISVVRVKWNGIRNRSTTTQLGTYETLELVREEEAENAGSMLRTMDIEPTRTLRREPQP